MEMEFTCFNCGKTVAGEPLSHHKVKSAEGEFCKFCSECEDVFNHAVKNISDPTGMVFPAGIVLGFGKRDPFFKIQLQYQKGCVPRWEIVSLEDRGGLVVFLSESNKYVEQQLGNRNPILTVPVKIIKKKDKIAFAIPYVKYPYVK